MPKHLKPAPVAMLLVLVLTWIAYRPGLSGPFLFDDFANLPALGATGPVHDFPSFARYVTSGIADPTGRPVALVSFLIDAQDWPADPLPFKRTNILIHLFNGVLLFLLLRSLGTLGIARPGTSTRRTELAALFASAAWLVHPLFVSTTLYVVQREAMLPATFVLIGLLGWLHGREWIIREATRRGILLASGSIAACTALAVLSKANGILLPVFVLVIEFGLLAHRRPIAGRSDAYRWLIGVCLVISAMVFGALLYLGAHGILHGIGTQRPWSLGQRLLTEPRVIWDYLRLLWLPRPFSAGVFNDQFVPSTSLLRPLSTLPAFLGIGGLAAAGIWLRRRKPALSTAILFFLVGHLVESTTIPLELYFEHRNYLPALLLFWPLGLWLADVPSGTSRSVAFPDVARASMAIAAIAGLAWMTHANATVWGNGREQALLWAALNPASPRAQVNAAQAEMSSGHPEAAVARLTPLLRQKPSEIQLALNMLAARCAAGSLRDSDLVAARVALQTARDPGTLLVSWFGRAIDQARTAPCQGLDLPAIEGLAEAGAGNTIFSDGRRQDLAHIQGLIALERRDARRALEAFDRALMFDPRPGIALEQAAMLGSAGYPRAGLDHLFTFDTLPAPPHPGAGMPYIHAWVLDRQDYWANERTHLEHTLRTDLHDGEKNP
ncbi:tetratricopeptide repeat protein [Luteibacter sp. 3190]|uniref:tetratricopeptide repeat protein n=1 Tax=Luteibacter sp. 3190 TaxID=2817736 RepID=UPI002859E986|nr:tetratricopeptide repeat protein [Luteibacter sp. 3190]MDR6934884.1 tetratricopeptide (TPR) repeat protein [Luteibacter sp. 3190]